MKKCIKSKTLSKGIPFDSALLTEKLYIKIGYNSTISINNTGKHRKNCAKLYI